MQEGEFEFCRVSETDGLPELATPFEVKIGRFGLDASQVLPKTGGGDFGGGI